MITVNTMDKGMSKDISKFRQQSDTYTDALNIRMQTTRGKSNGSIETIKGNELAFAIPHVYNCVKLQLTGVPLTGDLTINSVTFTKDPTIQTGKELRDFIYTNWTVQAALENRYDYVSGVLQSQIPEFGIFFGDDFVLLQGITQNVAVGWSGNGISDDVLVTEVANSAPIGYANIRDETIIFATAETVWSENNIGQIWRAVFTDTIETVVLYLEYNQHFGLAASFPIMEEAIGFYNRGTNKAVYWTDNKNSLRKFSFLDESEVINTQPFCLDPLLLNIFPPTTFSKPILQSIQLGGSLTSGTKQYAYRCSNTGGNAESGWSELSNIINVIAADENTAQYNAYRPYNLTTNKSVTLKIENIDTNYDKIEIVCVEKVSDNGIPLIRIIKQDVLSKTGTYIFTHYGSENTIEITLNEFLAFNNTFNTCKSIANKNNHLFAANIKQNTFDPGATFDTRAYRFDGGAGGVAVINDSDGNLEATITSIGTTFPNLGNDKDFDCINPDEDVYKYKLGTSEYGGTGPNISYEFGTKELIGDDYTSTAMMNSASDITSTDGFVRVNRFTSNITQSGEDYPVLNTPINQKSPYIAGLERGYWLGETYRFAIVFYDKQGVPGYANWIADIKFPKMHYTNSNPGTYALANGITDFRNSFEVGTQCILQVPYIKFSIDNLSDLEDTISGYSIVRVDRQEADKTIIGQGLAFPAVLDTGSYYPVASDEDYIGKTIITVHSPDHLFNQASFTAGSYMRAVARVEESASGFDSTNTFNIIKYEKDTDPLSAGDNIVIDELYSCEIPTTDSVAVASIPFFNYYLTAPGTMLGSKVLVLKLNSAMTHGFVFHKVILVNLERDSSGRYGGSDYAARANNIYIGCGHYSTDLSDPITNIDVLGGDCFISCFVKQMLLKNWATNSGIGPAGLFSWILSFPVCSTVNCELREGAFPNLTEFTNSATGAVDRGEDYSYNGVFSDPMDIRKYAAKPLNLPDVNEYDTRVYASDLKIAGETNDSWSVFKPNNFLDMENYYGPITDILEHTDKLLVLQDKGLVNISVNPRSLIQDSSGAQLVLGTGDVLSRYDYLDQNSGSIHQNSVLKTPKGVYYYDAYTHKLMFYNNVLSDIKGMHGWLLETFNENLGFTTGGRVDSTLSLQGICSTYDSKNKECWFTFLMTDDETHGIVRKTLVYNELFECFTGFYSHTPYMYINTRKSIYSPNYGDDEFSNTISRTIYKHDAGDECKFYSVQQDAYIEFIVNENPTKTKLFQSVRFHTDALNTSNINMRDITFTEIEAYNDYQATSVLPLTVNSNIGRYEREWRTEVPKNAIKDALYDVDLFNPTNYDLTRKYREILTDKFMYLKLYYTPVNNKLILNYLETEYLPSAR